MKDEKQYIKVKNTYDVPISGGPLGSLEEQSASPRTCGLMPSAIQGIKPKLQVKVGDSVRVGSSIFSDKKNPKVKFLSPASGTVKEIHYGEKRRLECVEIECDSDPTYETLPKLNGNSSSRDDIVNTLLAGGVWGHLKQAPYQNIPSPDEVAPAIYVTLDNDEPYLPQSHVYLASQEAKENLKYGISLLKRLTNGPVYVGAAHKNEGLIKDMGADITHTLDGKYPANDPLVFLYYAKQSQEENSSWYIKAQDLLEIVELCKTGRYPNKRVITISGSLATTRKHFLVQKGSSIESLIPSLPTEAVRYIAGGVLTGRNATAYPYLGFGESAFHLLSDKIPEELFYFTQPGGDKASFTRTFVSALIKKAGYKMTTALNGGHRACISCGDCVKVCPVESHPQMLLKSIVGGELEESIKLGVLDCSDCGLCTYVCPSKIELDTIIKTQKVKIEKESNANEMAH